MSRKSTWFRSASVAALATLPVIVACALLGATGARAATCTMSPSTCEPFVVTFEQAAPGANIVGTGAGEFDTAGLTLDAIGIINRALIAPSVGQFLFGPSSGVQTRDTLTGPTNTRFSGITGTTPITDPISTSGLGVGVNGGIFNPSVTIPASYVPGTVITSQAIFPVTSISCATTVSPCDGLGMQPDQVFTWTWGSSPDQSFTINTTLLAPPSEIPLPAALPLMGSVLGLGGLLAGWRKRRSKQVAV